MYQQFWPYAIFVIIAIVSTQYLANNSMSPEFGALMVFLSYLVIAYIVATSMRHTIIYIEDEREKSIRLSFDCLIGLFLLVTGYCMYSSKLLSMPSKLVESSGKLLSMPGKVLGTSIKGAKSISKMVY